MKEFSIAIPAHDRGENGPLWMRELLESLKEQTFQNFEVVVSDQSKNDLIMNVCQEYSDFFEFTYVKYTGSVPCENINVALDNCEGRIIKTMFSDDLFVRKDALEIIRNQYKNKDCKWAFNGFCGTKDGKNFYDEKTPRWTDYMLEGRNLLSSPSAVSFLNKSKVYFDENLKLFLDTEFYHRMRWKNGMPHIISEVLISNRDHDDRISSQQNSQYDAYIHHEEGSWMVNSKEIEYIYEKHSNFIKERKYPDEI